MSRPEGMTPHQADSSSFTVQPVDPADLDGGGSAPFTGGSGDATHPEDWASNLSLPAMRERVLAAGLDPGDRDTDELIELLKQTKPSNRTASIGTTGPGASGGHG
ncbi:MAG: hypothetical protein JWN62_1359 [Acidimicrobiales bacterium]|nr:hypothetical protein [Acidimicrobiales bacterium]